MSAARRFKLPALIGALALAACTPPYIDKAQLRFAKDYYKGCAREACPMSLEAMSLDQLYAVHLYGRRFHPWRGMSGEFARRGAGTIPFLRARLGAARDGGEVGSIFEIVRAMERLGTFDPRSDPGLIASIQEAASRVKDPGYYLRDEADDIETGEQKPFGFGAGLRWLEGLGKDYDNDFAKRHCRGCDYRAWKEAAEKLPIDKLYAVQRYGWEHFTPSRNLDLVVARRGAEAIPFLKTRLAIAERGLMLLNILSTLELMRHLGTFEPRSDPELIALAESAAARQQGNYAPWVRESAERLRSGAPHPRIEQLTGLTRTR